LSDDLHLRNGLNACRGLLTHPAVAHDIGLPLTPAERALTD
jgi:alanine dehydrogenase